MNQPILIIDNSSQIGGATRRVEFEAAGRRLITNGGASAQTAPRSWNSAVIEQFRSQPGIDLSRFEGDHHDRPLYSSPGLETPTFFNAEDYGHDRTIRGTLTLSGLFEASRDCVAV